MRIPRNRSIAAALVALAAVVWIGVSPARSASGPGVLRLDYAYYNPVSLVLRRFGWVEEAFRRDGVHVEWVLSLGSNKANEHLASGAVQFGSTAGSAALLARANGVPLRTVWIYSRPEWTALVVPGSSPLRGVEGLKGKKVAATRGTDPWFFLLQALDSAGLSQRDVTLVPLQHPDGEQALLAGQVDAWAGLDPYMAHAEVAAGARLLLRRPGWNTYGTLNVLESFLRHYPDAVQRVLTAYERGRRWALANPDGLVRLLSEESHLAPEVARKVLRERTAFPDPRPGEAQRVALRRIAPLLAKEDLVPPGTDLEAAIDGLLDPDPASRVLASGTRGSR